MALSFCQSSRRCLSLSGLIIFFIMFHVHPLDSASFKVDGSQKIVTGIVGQEIILPCHLIPRMNAMNMEVKWFRPQSDTIVHLYHNRTDQLKNQLPEYKGRTELLKDSITDGSVPLKIVNITVSDEGKYHCFVQDGISYGETLIELKVAGLGSGPLISMEDYQDGGIRMVCRSAGWFPEPEVLWKGPTGQHLSSVSETKFSTENGLFKMENSIVIQEHSNKNLSCLIRNNLLNQEKESAIYVSDPFFPRLNPWMVALAVLLVGLLILLVLTLYLFKLKTGLQQELVWRNDVICPGLGKTELPVEKVNVVLNPDTAHPRLIVSEDKKSVKWALTQQMPTKKPEQFETRFCVLGKEGFTSGRHCWEVHVGNGIFWAVGVAKEPVKKQEVLNMNPDDGIWAVQRWWGEYWALTSPRRTLLLVNQIPKRVGVYLDCDSSRVVFFDADTEAIIFSFPPATFAGGTMYPWFWVGVLCELKMCH
ncbi:butyrophilin subfamily 1 member A1 [Alligator mississippiensis]|uniref:butyrophilin subfamily 1 member A1 n=1 Tax=Alligator mississippiensis TaxID=8496 RepID=UPI002877ACB8|nr:butyrophilin subfamily 1 member A1 [Alligator mississippiensis]XP_019352201.2 butyrophilin subfamily 1 member A1 [Alligator mississippiensis]XP_019352202.2 butyrophilin subfamily 1 member A1 [Alligator mississippiensis]